MSAPSLYVVVAHGRFWGREDDWRFWPSLLAVGITTRQAWVSRLGDAILYPDKADALRVAKRHGPCADVVAYTLVPEGYP